MERYLCIHCHFYQPPRENPWLEAIERQDSADPYHDWNERITAECYAPNAAARILNSEGKISRIVNNYASISYNFGPTLLSWMEEKTPEIYSAILESDALSREKFSGHGNAIAQAYNHTILPLSNLRDRQTQVLWGLKDFEHRFGRAAEGMWLPETAVDELTLETLADAGVKFTILAPHQAARVRKLGGIRSFSVEGGNVDPTRAYVYRLPSGREINLFFYDGPISRAVAFEGLLSNGEHFAGRLLSGFSDARRWPQLMHIATDGETYGHHHRHGEMALAYALHHIESNQLAKLTNYGEFLEKNPPTHEAEIVADTAWSCAHGVGRWKSNCGCSSGMKSGWTQHWREPLRNALDSLRDSLEGEYERSGAEILKDPWLARNEYISVILQRTNPNVEAFLDTHLLDPIDRDQRSRALKLLEMQRHLMLMYTSCGWFFDELSGIETVQVMMYAARALQLARDVFEGDHEPWFLEMLKKAQSNLPLAGSGADIYQRWIAPAEVDLLKVAAHYAMTTLFHRDDVSTAIHSYEVRLHDEHRFTSGRAKMFIGKANICSRVTLENMEVSFAAVHFGDHNINAGVRPFRSEEAYRNLLTETSNAFRAADLPSAIRLLDRHFEGVTYNIRSLFKDEQQRALREILGSAIQDAEGSYRQIYEHHAPLMGFIVDVGARMPRVLSVTAEFVLNAELRKEFEKDSPSPENVRMILDAAERDGVALDGTTLGYVMKRRLDAMGDELAVYPHTQSLERYREILDVVRSLPFEVDLWKLQNTFYQLLQTIYPEIANGEDEQSRRWARDFAALGEALGVNVGIPAVRPEGAAA
jgi:alpha-amylase/alpha-mannosidase (GH57 family)